MACGESTRAYGNRMDNIWALRAAFAMARGFRDAQDAFCARAEAGLWDGDGSVVQQAYPEDYRWEVLVDVLRGKAKVSTRMSSNSLLLTIVELVSARRCRCNAKKPSIWMPWSGYALCRSVPE